ncbi:MAG: hypothetical protein IJA61_02355 [Clostridia bacterium]|nr:hypothetical protein [Clostridia bacterium]
MEVNELIRVEGKKIILLERVVYNRHYYYIAAELNEENAFANKYAILKELRSDGKRYLEKIKDQAEFKAVYDILEKEYDTLTQELETFMKVGTVVEILDREYILLDYIAYADDIYMVFSTTIKPLDIRVARLEYDENDERKYVDVTESDITMNILKIHAITHTDKPKFDTMNIKFEG